MQIMLTGSGGMLAWDLIQQLLHTKWKIKAFSRSELNICHSEQVHSCIIECEPDVLVNCAAYTHVDHAETHEAEASRVNTKGVGVLAQCCKKQGVKLIHISTDFVFNGDSKRPYTEKDITDPVGVYGKTKREGEYNIQKSGVNFLIVRTSWLYGLHGGNFVKTMLKLAEERKEIRVVHDQTGSPTWSKDLANAIIHLIQCEAQGIIHFSNSGQCSWYEFAQKIFEMGHELEIISCKPLILPVPTNEYPTPAKRPSFSVLNTSLYSKMTQESPPSWENSLRAMLTHLQLQHK